MDIRQIKAIEKQNKERILASCKRCPDRSGIYMLTREENGLKFAYIGQAKKILTRLAGHLKGYQHIDLSLRKHGLYSEKNPTGWRIDFCEFEEKLLDEKEREYIRGYANMGFQLRNKTDGGQGVGKAGIDNNKQSKGYYDGIEQGKKNTRKFIADLFNKHLIFRTKSDKPSKLQLRAYEKFENFLKNDNDE